MSPYTSIEYQRRKIEKQLEEGLEQPVCGCRIVYEWLYTNQLEPTGVGLIRVEPCDRGVFCLTPDKVLPMAETMMQTLVDRLQKLGER